MSDNSSRTLWEKVKDAAGFTYGFCVGFTKGICKGVADALRKS